MRRTKEGEETHHARFPFRGRAPNNPSQGIPGPFSLGFDFRSWWSPFSVARAAKLTGAQMLLVGLHPRRQKSSPSNDGPRKCAHAQRQICPGRGEEPIAQRNDPSPSCSPSDYFPCRVFLNTADTVSTSNGKGVPKLSFDEIRRNICAWRSPARAAGLLRFKGNQ